MFKALLNKEILEFDIFHDLSVDLKMKIIVLENIHVTNP
jgi:hypothetical protein